MTTKTKQYDDLNNEGYDGYNPMRAARKANERNDVTRLDALERNADAAFADEWTAETTAARRAEWNTYSKTNFTGSVTHQQIAQAEKELGYTMADLKRAVHLNQ